MMEVNGVFLTMEGREIMKDAFGECNRVKCANIAPIYMSIFE